MRRHDWAYLAPGARPAVAACAPEVRAWIHTWLAGGGPLVVARQGVPPGRLALGAVAPGRLGRARVACIAAADEVVRVRGPVTAAEAAGVLAPAMAAALVSLQRALRVHGGRLGVYGSIAWSYFTAEDYRHAASDVDVVCDLEAAAGLAGCLAALEAAQATLSCRLDGELRFACGRAVAWRELAAARRDGVPWVLAKGPRDVGMTAVRDLVAAAA